MPFSCTAIYFGNVYETLEHDPPQQQRVHLPMLPSNPVLLALPLPLLRLRKPTRRTDWRADILVWSGFRQQIKANWKLFAFAMYFLTLFKRRWSSMQRQRRRRRRRRRRSLSVCVVLLYLIRYWLHSRVIRKYLQFIQTNIKIKFKYAYRGKYLRRICGLFIWLWR